jgi:hypothetical protein
LNIRWTVHTASGSELAEIIILSSGVISGSSDDYTGVLCDVSGAAPNTVLTAKLNFSLSGNTDVRCFDNIQGPAIATLQMASKQSLNVHFRDTIDHTQTTPKPHPFVTCTVYFLLWGGHDVAKLTSRYLVLACSMADMHKLRTYCISASMH